MLSSLSPSPKLCTATMPGSSIENETISTVPNEKLSSMGQIHLPTLSRALKRKSTYRAYKALRGHRSTLECLNAKVNLRAGKADDALNKASEDRRNTEIALTNACASTASPYPTTRPAIVGEVLRGIIGLQKFYEHEKVGLVVECRREQRHVQTLIRAVNKRVGKVEEALVQKFGIHTVDDEENPLLNVHNIERIIDVMASIPGMENI